jgi:hypothetical protein
MFGLFVLNRNTMNYEVYVQHLTTKFTYGNTE